jgi:hypothetical protein
MSDLGRLRIWDDPAIRDGLSWYLAVAENRRPAKFRIAVSNMQVGAMRLGMKVQIFSEGLHYRILRACPRNIVPSKSTAKAERSLRP